MATKFKVGDWVICPTADIPKALQIKGITDGMYVFAYDTSGRPHNHISVTNHQFVLCTPDGRVMEGKSITKSDILDLMRTVSKKTGRFGTNSGAYLTDEFLNQLYTTWKHKLRHDNI